MRRLGITILAFSIVCGGVVKAAPARRLTRHSQIVRPTKATRPTFVRFLVDQFLWPAIKTAATTAIISAL